MVRMRQIRPRQPVFQKAARMQISQKVERTNSSWQNAHKKLVRCTERNWRVIDFWIALSNVIIIVGRLLRRAWTNYRWEGRPSRRP